MPITIKNEQDEDVEVFTKEELEASLEAQKVELAKTTTEVKTEEMPEWAKSIKAQVDALGGTVQSTVNGKYLDKVSAGLDADKSKDLTTKFESLTGYEDTAEGRQRRAEDAYLLTVGERYTDGGVNMNNLSNASGAKNSVTTDAQTSAADKEIQSMLGITAADVEKYKK